ncbi:MAG: hypothetical protein FWE06_04140 [Oscillospiraceae bacterium]|nr:hypothetical protein [Oscillospiraceae bacterium]
MKKLLILALVLVALAAFMTACADNDDPANENGNGTEVNGPTDVVQPTEPNDPTEEEHEPTPIPPVEPAVLEEPLADDALDMFVVEREPLAFADVPDDAEYKQYLDFVTARGLISGVVPAEGDQLGEFRPDSLLQFRAGLSITNSLHRIFGGYDPYPEGDQGSWEENVLAYSEYHGIFTEEEMDEMAITPGDELFGNEMAIVFARAFPPEMFPVINDINEVPGMTPGTFGFDETLLLMRAGVLAADFDGSQDVYRWEMAVALARMISPELRIQQG